MALDADTLVTPASIAKTASIATVGHDWAQVGATGEQPYTLRVPFPSAPTRTLIPALALTYSGSTGNGMFGLGWNLSLPVISRKTSKGVPKYEADDVMQADSTDLRPELTSRGKIKTNRRTLGKGRNAKKYLMVRYIPRLQTTFAEYQRWTAVDGSSDYWIVFTPDGAKHCYGFSSNARIYDPADPTHIAMWLPEETRNALGENIYYEYKADDKVADDRFDYQAQRYLRRICYCNKTPSTGLYCLEPSDPGLRGWLYEILFDYGERVTREAVPSYSAPEDKWPRRSDPFRNHRFGFPLGTRRMGKEILAFSLTSGETKLVERLRLEHGTTPCQYQHLTAAHYMSYDANGNVKCFPPLELFYEPPILNLFPQAFLALDHMPGLNDGEPYHCVDLYGEGLPGFLCQHDNFWYYREPLRGTPGTDEIVYGPWTLLPLIPNADSSKPVVVILMDITGDGHLDWVVAQPGGSGYYTFNPDGTWSLFKPFSRFPVEFFHLLAQLGDFSGDGQNSMALIGPNCVRVYANLRETGFAPGEDVPHTPNRLPLFSDAKNEMVTLNGLGGSGMELCRIRHDEIRCWISLGHGRFGEGFRMSALPFEYGEFDPDRVRIADVEGSGAPAFIYLFSDYFEIWLNHGGNGLAEKPIRVFWPKGVRYDNLCQVTFADLQGIGCASLVLTVPHMKPQHWVYHFFSARPYLLTESNNNMGYNAKLQYRSSAQFWLDEKSLEQAAGRKPVCHLPFPQMVLHWLRQEDEITGNYLMQFYKYFDGYYDGIEREFRGFGRVCQIDSELEPGKAENGHTAPTLNTQWFHIGDSVDRTLKETSQLDPDITPLGLTLVSTFDAKRRKEHVRKRRKADDNHEIAYALAGRLLRTEIRRADAPASAGLLSLGESRFLVRKLDETQSSLLVLELETRTHQYEGFMNDSRCQHVVNKAWDPFGHLIHGYTVACARRRIVTDEPPFEAEDQRRAWQDSHDKQQEDFYLTEVRAEPVHLIKADHRLLGLPWLQRSNALMLPKGALPGGLSEPQISYENFTEHQDSPTWNLARELTSLSKQTYLEEDGDILFPPRQGPLEQAVFDKKALAAYDDVPIVIRDELRKIGYRPMNLFLPVDSEEDKDENLWSSLSGFFTFAGAADFFHVTQVQQTESHGVTSITRDEDNLVIIRITLPDGCSTTIEYDPHTLQPRCITDPNDNKQQVLYEAGGQPLAHSFHGTEEGVATGFKPLSDYPPQPDLSVAHALANPEAVVASAAGVVRTELFSWMPLLPLKTARLKRKDWIAKGLILPDGHIRASALRWLNQKKKRTAAEQTLLKIILSGPRQPVHSLVMVADRYHDDALQQIQKAVTFVDGLGRELQSKQHVPEGVALVATPEGYLEIDDDGKPIEQRTEKRWRVKGRVEYNHKGESIRVFQPYFLDSPRYINDSAIRTHGHHDQMFYDALGRQIKTINALGYLAYLILHPWFELKYDYNDTDESPPGKTVKKPTSAKSAKPAKKVKS